MPTKKKKFNARFPPARIKKIMQTDEEVGKVAAAVPVIISKALEMFMQNLMLKASEYTQARNAKTMTTSHLKWCITSEKQFDFLKDLVASVPDLPANEEDGDGETKPKRRKAQPGEGKKKKRQSKQKVQQPQSSDSEDEEQESEEEESGSSENQAAAMANVTNTAIPKITVTGPDSEHVDKIHEPPAMSINVPISSQLSFGTSMEEEDDDYDS